MMKPKTIFCDIDGVLFKHDSNICMQSKNDPHTVILPGVLEKLQEWERKGYKIILTTGRKESMRKDTIDQLSKIGIFYDQLITGLGGGVRVLINDMKKGKDEPTAYAINLVRDKGIKDVDI